MEDVKLNRSLNLPTITFYGVGTIVGGGFYALIGKVSAEAGMLTPVALLVSLLIAMFSALSYAELSSRYPLSAGEAHYVRVAFGRDRLAAIVGWLVISTGVVSAATLANAFANFVQAAVDLPTGSWLGLDVVDGVILLTVVGLGLIAAWGIGESAVVNIVITLIECGGLVVVFCYGSPSLTTLGQRWPELVPSSWAPCSGILLGAYLSFYSFVGFEDMVNLAEEVKQPERNLPQAILASLLITGALYVGVALVTVLSVPLADLRAARSPLSLVMGDGIASQSITVVGMLAGINGALVQIVMAARVIYGLAQQGQAHRWFAKVHPWTQTPLSATGAVTVVVLVLAIWFPLVPLALATSTILLVIYAAVNLSLWWIKRQKLQIRTEGPSYPRWLPLAGFVVCLGFLAFRFWALLFGRQ